MKIIDIDSWERKKSYLWFSTFSDPTYVLTARLDVTPLIKLKREKGLKFYEAMLYLAVKGLNSVPALRLRVEEEGVVEYESPIPSFTVALEDGLFDICNVPWTEDPHAFMSAVREEIEAAKLRGGNKDFGDERSDKYYFSCLPWLDFDTMTNPIPDSVNSLSIPRICWGKYVEKDGRYTMSYSVQVSHALVDGRPLCDVFANTQKLIDDCEQIFKS